MCFLWYPSSNHLPSFEALASDPENFYTLTVYRSQRVTASQHYFDKETQQTGACLFVFQVLLSRGWIFKPGETMLIIYVSLSGQGLYGGGKTKIQVSRPSCSWKSQENCPGTFCVTHSGQSGRTPDVSRSALLSDIALSPWGIFVLAHTHKVTQNLIETTTNLQKS